jgi:hypothetical protein
MPERLGQTVIYRLYARRLRKQLAGAQLPAATGTSAKPYRTGRSVPRRRHSRGPVVDTVQDASPQVTAMIDKIAQDNLRYRILHAGARLTRGGRRRILKIAASWPWAEAIITAWQRIQALPAPG